MKIIFKNPIKAFFRIRNRMFQLQNAKHKLKCICYLIIFFLNYVFTNSLIKSFDTDLVCINILKVKPPIQNFKPFNLIHHNKTKIDAKKDFIRQQNDEKYNIFISMI